MNILIIDNYYDDFLQSFYSRHPEVDAQDFDAHRALLMAQHFGTSDAYSYNLKKLGHEAQEIITNDDRLQMKWAQENGIRTLSSSRYLNYGLKWLRGYNWRYKIIKAQVKQIRPDVLYIQEGNILSDTFIAKLKPLVKLIVGQIASARPSNRTYLNYNLMVTSFPHFVEYFKDNDLNAIYQPLSFDDRMLEHFQHKERTKPVTFVGGFSPKTYQWSTPVFEEVAKQLRIDCWGCGIELLDLHSPLRRHYHGEAWGLNAYKIFSESRITLNRHGEISEHYANNMRLFEATGMGACLVTDWKENLHELFVLEKEVVTYRSADELVEKVNYLLAHDKERAKIAKAGQERTLRGHNYFNRMKELIEIMKNPAASRRVSVK